VGPAARRRAYPSSTEIHATAPDRLGTVARTSATPSRTAASPRQRGTQDARPDPNAGLEDRSGQSRGSRQSRDSRPDQDLAASPPYRAIRSSPLHSLAECRRSDRSDRRLGRPPPPGCSSAGLSAARCRKTPQGITAAWWPLRCKFGSAGRRVAAEPVAARAKPVSTGRLGLARSGGRPGPWA
jgi:hypothetical protein